MLVENLFLFPLVMAFIGQVSAYLMRVTAPNFGSWLYRLADLLSILSGLALLWSLVWALLSQAVRLDVVSPTATIAGFAAVVIGAGLVLWSAFTLGGKTFLAGPEDEVVDRGPYAIIRRPMSVGMYVIGVGAALISGKDTVWIWLGVFFALSLALSELEEWELRQRVPEATDYFSKIRRFFPRSH